MGKINKILITTISLVIFSISWNVILAEEENVVSLPSTLNIHLKIYM